MFKQFGRADNQYLSFFYVWLMKKAKGVIDLKEIIFFRFLL